MAQPSQTFDAYDSIGNREDLSDVIYNIAPYETPFFNGVKKVKATNINHEWQTDTLDAVSDNKVIQGDDATTDAIVATVRLNNRTQIQDKVVLIAGTTEAVNRAGRKSEMAYQMALKGRVLKKDAEHALVGLNNAKVTGNSTTAAELASVQSWIATNTSAGTGGSDPTGDGTDARTDGTQRVFTETLLKTVIQSCWSAGGSPTICMVGAFNKTKASEFTGNSTRYDRGEDKKVTAAVDFYVSDFGTVQIVPNRLLRSRDALVLDMDMWAVAMLRPAQAHMLAKTGDSTRKQLLHEFTLEARNEAASGIVADLTTS